jgi:hypothetical protein
MRTHVTPLRQESILNHLTWRSNTPRREERESEVPNLKSVEKVGKGKCIAKPDEEEDRMLTQ